MDKSKRSSEGRSSYTKTTRGRELVRLVKVVREPFTHARSKEIRCTRTGWPTMGTKLVPW